MGESLSSSPAIRVGIITFPGTLDDVDAARTVCLTGAEPVSLWYKGADLRGVDTVVVPRSFPYSGYPCCDAIACFAPVMEEVVVAAECGMPVLSIYSGFQILAEAHPLPGALLRNASQHFICVEQCLCTENTQTAQVGRYADGNETVVPAKNGEGNFIAFPEGLDRLEKGELVVLRYVGNSNSSACDVAGACDERGNVVGPMPHPEHAVEPGFGPGSQTGPRTGIDGLGAFHSTIDPLLAV